jgi:hypothetical protein
VQLNIQLFPLSDVCVDCTATPNSHRCGAARSGSGHVEQDSCFCAIYRCSHESAHVRCSSRSSRAGALTARRILTLNARAQAVPRGSLCKTVSSWRAL